MIGKLGDLLLLFEMFLSLIVIVRPNISISKKMFITSASCGVASFLILVFGFIISDFSVQNIFLNSSTLKPLIFKISAAWASHEGSMLFWLGLLDFICITYVVILPAPQIATIQLRVLSLIIFLFSGFIYFTSNPFITLSFTPTEGLGLNPTLQDIALAIHPPILYLGYVSYVVLFTNAIIILIKSDDEKLHLQLLEVSKKFSNFGLTTLTMGIGIGAWWAYRELGWGGYWYFDPVENISLMPWLAGIALHHSLLISVNQQKALNWTLSLSIFSFLLTIVGTFLVRSGLLTSIHSFNSSADRSLYLFVVLIVISLPSIFLLIVKSKPHKDLSLNFKEKGIIAGNILWTFSTVVILAATLYPIIYLYLFGESISLDSNFFTAVFLPIIILILYVAGTFSNQSINNSTLTAGILSLLVTIFSTHLIKHNNISALSFLGAIYLIIQTIYIFMSRSNFFRLKLSLSFNSMILGHLGFGLLALCITLNSMMQKEFEFTGVAGSSKIFDQFEVNLKGIKLADGPNYYRQIAEFWITDHKSATVTVLKPENRYYKIEKTLSQESDIFSYLMHDLYAVMSRIDNDTVHARIYYRPFVSFIWLSIFIMASGFMGSLFNRPYKSKIIISS